MFHPIYDVKNSSFRKIWKTLKKSRKVLLMLHARPDGDSLGSCTAMKYVLENAGVKVKLVSKDPVNNNLDYYNFSKEVEYGVDIERLDLKIFDYIIFLDHGSLSDFSEDFRNRLKESKVIDIDHHVTNLGYGNINYVNPQSPSCCSILYDMFENLGIKFEMELSLRLMVGICTDTAFFIHGDSLNSMRKAIRLIESGKLNYKKDIFDPLTSNSWKLKKLHGILLTNMEKKEVDGKVVAYSTVSREEHEKAGLNVSDLRFGISCMQDIKGIDVMFTLTELDGGIRGSFRSKEFDTTLYSSELGGGGHKLASGFVLKNTNAKRAAEKVLKVIRDKGFVTVSSDEKEEE